MGTGLKYTAPTLEILSVISVFGSFDPSGSLFRFVQGILLIVRLRMLQINYGVVLESLFKSISIAFDEYEDFIEINKRRRIQLGKIVFPRGGGKRPSRQVHGVWRYQKSYLKKCSLGEIFDLSSFMDL